jgi:UDP-hydrolysing UDP-N-acetyl-D-glucosamine 2-epimerase
MIPKGNTNYDMGKGLGVGIIEFSNTFRKFKPDLNLILGDRDEALASALAAFHMNIPNVHISGGDKTKAGLDESIRHAITKISNIHFPITDKSKKRIIKMGESQKFVFNFGSPSIDMIYKKQIISKHELEKKYKIKFTGDDILLIQHPVTTEPKKSKKQISVLIKGILKTKQIVFAIAPNSDAGNNEIFQTLELLSKTNSKVYLFKNIRREDYLGFLKYSGVLIGNSSSGIVEAAYLNTNVINIGIRQKDRESDSNVHNIENPTSEIIEKTINKFLKLKKVKIKNHFIYGKGNSCSKILKILEEIKIDEELIQKQIEY